MSALGTWAPSAASQESKAPEALTHGERSASKAGGVGPVTAALPWERQVLTRDLVVVDEDEGVGAMGPVQGAVASGNDPGLRLVDVGQPRHLGQFSGPGRLRPLGHLRRFDLLSGFDDGARTALRVIVDDENAR